MSPRLLTLLCACQVHDVSDLRSGQVLMDVVAVVLQDTPPHALTLAPSHAGPPAARHREVVRSISLFMREMGSGSDSLAAEQAAQHEERLSAMLQESDLRLTDADLLWLLALLRRTSGNGGRLRPASNGSKGGLESPAAARPGKLPRQRSAPEGAAAERADESNEPGPAGGAQPAPASSLRSPASQRSPAKRQPPATLQWGDLSPARPPRRAPGLAHARRAADPAFCSPAPIQVRPRRPPPHPTPPLSY